MIELPRTIPLFGRRIGLECLDAPQQRHRRPVAGGHFKRRLEGGGVLRPSFALFSVAGVEQALSTPLKTCGAT
jgi:hypothetical protein